VEIEGYWIFSFNTFVDYVAQKDFLDSSYTRFRNLIGLTVGDKFLRERSEVALVWPFKDCVLEGGQTKEEEKRNELFFNEVLAQDELNRLLDLKVLTNFARYTSHGEEQVTDFRRSEDEVLQENLVIRGNNLIALHTVKTQLRESARLIYIDPPYNTDDDEFKYNDRFEHSTWLTFMRNRLVVAKELLAPNGLIFVQINDIEHAYLKVLMDEVFGRECFQASICVKMAHLSGPKMAHKEKRIPKVKEHILVYAKSVQKIKLNPQYVPVTWAEAFDRYENFLEKNGSTDLERWESLSLRQALEKYGINVDDENERLAFLMEHAHLIFQTAINRSKDYPRTPVDKFLQIGDKYVLNAREVIFAQEKIQEFDGVRRPTSIVSDIWTDIGINNVFQEGGREISLRFGKKPEMLLQRIIALATDPGDLVVDFFLGTGTTCAVAHKMGRRYLGIEQLDYGENDSVARLRNVIRGDKSGISKSVNWNGGGDFIYCELMKFNEAFIDLVQAAQSSEALEQIWLDVAEGSFLNWYVNPKVPEDAIRVFKVTPKY